MNCIMVTPMQRGPPVPLSQYTSRGPTSRSRGQVHGIPFPIQKIGKSQQLSSPSGTSYADMLIILTHLLETKKPPNINRGKMRIGPVAIARDREFVAVDTR